jgi:hypothetical protein
MNPDLLSLLPGYFKVILDFIELMKTEDIELAQLDSYVTRVYDNLFIQTADAATIAYHEGLFHITASPFEDLDFRRLRLLNRYNNVTPLTLPVLRERLNQIIGEGAYAITMDYANYTITVQIYSGALGIGNLVADTLLFIIPAHIVQVILQPLEAVCTSSVNVTGGQSVAMLYTLS